MPEESLGTRIGNWFLKPVYEDKNITFKARVGENGQAIKGADGKTIYDVEDGIPRVLDWNGDGTIDTLEAIGTGGAALALGGLAARKLYKKHKERKAQQQFSEDEANPLSNAVNKIADKAKEHPNISGAALGVGLAAAASKLIPEEAKQRIRNVLFSKKEKEGKRKLSLPAKMAIAGTGLAAGVLVGDKFDVVDKSRMAVDKVADYLRNLDIDWTKLDVSKDGSPVDEVGVAVGIPAVMYGAGKVIQNSKKVKSPDRLGK